MKYILSLVVTLLLSIASFAQEETPTIPRSGLSMSALGTSGIAGVTYDFLIKNRLLIEAGGGHGGFGAGATVFIKPAEVGVENWYTGIKFNALTSDRYTRTNVIYVPIAAMLFSQNGFYGAVEMAPALFHKIARRPAEVEVETSYPFIKSPSYAVNAFGSIKIGFRFQVLGNK